MKATVRMMKGGTGNQCRSTYKALHYLFCPIKNNFFCLDRVSWIGGHLDGYGVIDRKAALMATAMDYGHEHFPGRRIRHVVLSCEPCEEAARADAERRLRESATLLAALLGARRWIAVIHRDTPKPHLHLILANYEEEKCRRFDYRRGFLSAAQDMTWTPLLETGKGHRTGIRGPRGQAIDRLRMLRQQEDPIKRNQALDKLHAFIAKHEASGRNKNAIVACLSSHDLAPGWDGAKLLIKSGKPRVKPSIVVDGIEIRIAFYLRWSRGLNRRTRQKALLPRRKIRDLQKRQPSLDGPSMQ